jgi:hypothetical protein
MTERSVLNAILGSIWHQNGLLDTEIGKTRLYIDVFFQQMYSKSHFKKFFCSKWLLEPL